MLNRDLRLRVRRFRALALVTTLAVYLLILVGGIVRASGAGMGCPDWPKCFDRWVPPTDEAQLPADYQQIYADRGYGETRFNATKTWTEYLNRMLGVGVGILVILTFLASLGLCRLSPGLPFASLGALISVVVAGWLGSVLIDTNLAGWAVTIHMLVALLTAGFLILGLVYARAASSTVGLLATTRLGTLFAFVLLLSTLQIALGTRVRGQIDELSQGGAMAAEWLSDLGAVFLIHRSLSIVVLVANLVLIYRIRRATLSRGPLHTIGNFLVLVLVLEIAAGAGLYYLEMPPVLQPIHLLLAAIAAGLQFGMWAIFRSETRRVM